MKNKEPLFELNKGQSMQLRGIAIVIVMLAHMRIVKNGSGGVALFLVLSGYGITSSYYVKGINRYWKKKIQNVYFPYLIAVTFQLFANKVTDLLCIGVSLLGLSFGKNIDGTYWFISYLFFWYFIFFVGAILNDYFYKSVFSIRPKKKNSDTVTFDKNYFLLIFIVITAIPILHCICGKGVWTKGSGAILYIYEFPLGVLLFLLSNIKIKKELKESIWISLLFISIVYICQNYSKINDSNYTTFTMSQAVMWLSIFQLKEIPNHPLLSFLGNYSYSIYLFEGFFWDRAYQWWDMITIKEIQHLVFFAISVLFGYIFQNCIFEKIHKNGGLK